MIKTIINLKTPIFWTACLCLAALMGVQWAQPVNAAPLVLNASDLSAYDAGFSYQGTLTDGGEPANGLYDFRFEILSEDEIIGAEYEADNVQVTDGLFSTTIGVTGNGIWNGQRRYLRVSARADGETQYIVITKPTDIEPAPYAFHARHASSATKADEATTLSNVGQTVVQVGTFDMIQSDGFTSLTFAAKNAGRMQVTRPAGLDTAYVYIPVDVPSQVIGFSQRLSSMNFCYSGAADNGIGVLAGIQEANVRQVNQFSATALLGDTYFPTLTEEEECISVVAADPQPVSGSLWVRFKITASTVPLEFGEIRLNFIN